MDKKKRAKILTQVKQDRAARRAVALELGLNKVHSHVFKTSKKDRFERTKNTIKEF